MPDVRYNTRENRLNAKDKYHRTRKFTVISNFDFVVVFPSRRESAY